MKNLLTAVLLILSINVFAQSFEGTIAWSWKTEITDPAKKAEMEQAQKMMSDPQKIAEMEKQMSDPQFQKMMEQNPQLKAQMEKMLNMMKSGELTSFMPEGMIVKIKDGNALSKLEGSFINNEFLFLKEKNQTYMIDHENKTYSITGPASGQQADEKLPDIKVTKTNETAKVLNYTCTKYLVEYTLQDGKKSVQTVWATTEIKGLDLSSMMQQQMGKGKRTLFFKEIDGVPLKMEMNWPEGKMLLEAKQIKRESLPSSDFVIPSDYKKL